MSDDNVRNAVNAVASSCDALLRANGYRRRGLNFRLIGAELVKYIGIQASPFAASGSARIAVNIGIYVPKAAALYYGSHLIPPVEKVRDPDCIISGRVTQACENQLDPRDKWWIINPSWSISHLHQATREIMYLLEECAIPFLRGFDSLIDVARFLESANPGAGHSMWPKENPMVLAAYRAIVCALMGDTGRGVELLDDAVENLHNQDARKHLQDVRQRVAALTTSQ